jgi:hypothetical protein
MMEKTISIPSSKKLPILRNLKHIKDEENGQKNMLPDTLGLHVNKSPIMACDAKLAA